MLTKLPGLFMYDFLTVYRYITYLICTIVSINKSPANSEQNLIDKMF